MATEFVIKTSFGRVAVLEVRRGTYPRTLAERGIVRTVRAWERGDYRSVLRAASALAVSLNAGR